MNNPGIVLSTGLYWWFAARVKADSKCSAGANERAKSAYGRPEMANLQYSLSLSTT